MPIAGMISRDGKFGWGRGPWQRLGTLVTKLYNHSTPNGPDQPSTESMTAGNFDRVG
jgi:hypothetical protein